MTDTEKKIAMAYALGFIEPSPEEAKRVKLGELSEEWRGYTLTSRGYAKSNNSYALYYDADEPLEFGKEHIFVRIAGFAEGWTIQRITYLIIETIKQHKAQLNE